MSVFERRSELLDHLEFKYGRQRGRLAAALDILSDLAIVIGTHTAYCQQAKSSTRPTRDLRDALAHVGDAKELIASLLNESNSPGSGAAGAAQ